jgi:hypothetical protein
MVGSRDGHGICQERGDGKMLLSSPYIESGLTNHSAALRTQILRWLA